MTVDLAALAKLASKATPGPWHTPGISLRPYTIYDSHDDDIARAWEAADADLMVAAVNALRAALADLDSNTAGLLEDADRDRRLASEWDATLPPDADLDR